jgi:hypothetical protein
MQNRTLRFARLQRRWTCWGASVVGYGITPRLAYTDWVASKHRATTAYLKAQT